MSDNGIFPDESKPMSATPIAPGSPASQGAANSGPVMSAEVAAQVKHALAPAAASAQHLNETLAQGKATLSGLGQLKSALAGFQAAANSLTASPGKPAGASAPAPDPAVKMQGFVDAYNALNGKLQTLQKGELKADPGLAQVRSQLAAMLGGAAGALGRAGVSVDGSGVMKLDKEKLAGAVQADPAAVDKLFAPAGHGIVDQLGERMGGYASANGVVARESASTGKQVEAIAARQATLTRALTAQASALAAFYTQQANAGAGGPTSLFDMLA